MNLWLFFFQLLCEIIRSTNLAVLGKLQVYSIRDAAANNLKRLAEEFGPDWALQHIIPQVIFFF